jgi:20S proteasome subunit beta 6
MAHNQPVSLPSIARLAHNMLYRKRFFPYYTDTMIGGLDLEGVGALYCYDSVGSYERLRCGAKGAAAQIITPFLDNQVSSFP